MASNVPGFQRKGHKKSDPSTSLTGWPDHLHIHRYQVRRASTVFKPLGHTLPCRWLVA